MVARRLLPVLALLVLMWRTPALAQQQCVTNCTHAVVVTPDGTVRARAITGTYADTFTVKDTSDIADTYTFTCQHTGGIGCVSVNPTSKKLFGSGDSVRVAVTYTVASSGLVILQADGANSSDNGNYSVLANPTVALVAPVLTSGSRAVVHNRQPLIRAFFTTNGSPIDSTRTQVTWRGTDVTTLFRKSRALVEWEVDSTHWLNAGGDSGQVSVSACSQGGDCTTVTRWVVLPNDSSVVLGFSGMPLEALGREFSAPFGPGLAVHGSEVETAIGSVPYMSMGAARSVGFVYSTRQSYPRALVPVDVELTWPAGTPDQLKVILSDGATKLDSVVVASPSCTSWNSGVRRCRTVLQGDFSGSAFGVARKWLTIEARVTSGVTTKISTDSVEVVLVDRRATPYGSGWWPSGVLQLVGAGSDRLLVGSSGTASVYRGNGDSVYIAPPGDFSILKKVGSTWELSPRGSPAKLVFDANGRLVKSLDANGNKDSLVYSASPDRVTSFIDPVGKSITVTYDGSIKISALSDGTRQTKFTVSGGQLTYDSISSPTSKPYTSGFVYQTYPGATGTIVLTKRVGVIVDTTEAIYDSTFRRRPVQAKLPLVQDTAGASVRPVVNYTSVLRKGFGGLVSLESTYVDVADPLGHWTRSLTNRWGQARKTWDAIDSIGRTEYSPEGFVLWSRGKTGDSSTVFSEYDIGGLGHLVATYIRRSPTDRLLLDSMVYDASHRVTQTIDALGHVTRVVYDANGNVTQSITPTNDTTFFWYRTDGLLDSTRAPHGLAATQHFTYDATTKNLTQVKNDTLVIATHYYDGVGRDTASDSKMAVQVTSTTTQFQWRRHETFYNVANQADSVRLLRTDNCASPCTSPSWPAGPDTNTTHAQHVRYVHDRAGRDSLRINDSGFKTEYVYDRLGRLVRRRPWTDSTAGPGPLQDSLVYNLAGNLWKTITRRGDVITSAYDTRNRDTLTIIPGVGTLRKAYAGPLDELTREWLDSPVDSIGAVNVERRWGFDARGRLRADTSYTGSTVRATTYTYDSFERPLTSTDPVGTWTTKYDAARGLADTLLTPMNDTVSYTFDGLGRALGPTIHGGGPSQAVQPVWTAFGEVSSVTQTVGGGSSYPVFIWLRNLARDNGPDGAHAPLGPVVLTQTSGSATPDTLQDSITYDGWQRVITVVSIKNFQHVVQARDTFNFDRVGNIKTTAGAEVYDLETTRLTAHAGSGCTWSDTYDRAGNLTQASCGSTTWTYQYDALNQLRSVRLGATLIARYAYDVSGRRIAKRVYSTASGGTVGYTRFIYHGANVAFETDSGGTIGLRYTWGGTDQLLAVDNGTNHYYPALDKLGSVRALVRRDGTWIMNQHFGPYGALISRDSSGSPGFALRYGWTGREYDSETGFYYFRARYFDLSVRRFVQEDPVEYSGSSNLYAYVDGDVMEARDPSGMIASKFWYFEQSLVAKLEGLNDRFVSAPACYLDGVPTACGLINRRAVDLLYDATTVDGAAWAGFPAWAIRTACEMGLGCGHHYHMSNEGLDFIRRHEGGPALRAYWDVNRWSIGYGTRATGPNQTMTAEQAETEFESFVNKKVQPMLDKITAQIGQEAVDALGDFIYQAGGGAFSADVLPGLNQGNWDAVESGMWRHIYDYPAGGPGVLDARLANRRFDEWLLMNFGYYGN